MRSSIIISLALHFGVVLLSVIGLPYIKKTPAKEEIPVVIEIVSISNETNVPAKIVDSPVKDLKEEKKRLNKKKVKAALPAKTIPRSVSSIPRPPKAAPNKKDKILKNIVKKRPPKLQTKNKVLRDARPRQKPPPPDPFASVLKNLAKTLNETKDKAKPMKVKQTKTTEFQNKIAKVLTRRTAVNNDSQKLTMTETQAMINTIKKTIRPCWNLQPGAKGAQDIVVVITASLTPDGRVAQAKVANRGELIGDPFRLAAAETAHRAILNQACQPFKLDPLKYHVWRNIRLSFNPSEMF